MLFNRDSEKGNTGSIISTVGKLSLRGNELQGQRLSSRGPPGDCEPALGS